jgi:TRAP-type mannitol/chloroaromatic compound transport system permease small subunit
MPKEHLSAHKAKYATLVELAPSTNRRSMKIWLKLSERIDTLNRRVGQLVQWLTLLMVLVGAFNALARYGGRFTEIQLSANAYIELQWYLFSLVFLLGAAHTLERDQHVRVDVFYGRLSERGKAWIDVIGGFVFLLPFCLFSLWVCTPTVRNSWAVREVSPDPGGLARYPIKTMILVCFALLLIQGVSEIIKRVATLRGVR